LKKGGAGGAALLPLRQGMRYASGSKVKATPLMQ
jgi:hypothetical protein